MQTNDKMLPTSEALAYLAEVWGFKRSPITLSKWASAGTGPPFRKLGSRFRYYSKVELDEWMQSRLSPRKRAIRTAAEDVTTLGEMKRKSWAVKKK